MCVLGVFGFSACDDIDDFTTSPSNLLTFSTDTVRIDTVFSTVPSSTRDFWVSNRSGKGLRCTSVRLEGGNQNGFRVNVDGVYLSPEQGYKANYIEVRNKDSIRVFVEVTTAVNHGDAPKELNDRLVFALESGVEQKVVLNAWSWDADFARNKTITTDYTITAGKPLVVYGPMTVEEGATLTIAPGATLFFHDGAGIDVKGRLVCKGTAEQPVTLRGYRLDYMFDYLPYDRMSGLWNGVRFLEKSYDNRMEFTDLHSAFNGVRVDSSDVARQTLTIANSTIHNCQGHALYVENSKVTVENSQLTNALNNCLGVEGGDVLVNNCTLAQFYPFDSNRASALSFSALKHPLQQFVCRNTLITGYSADEMMGGKPVKDAASEDAAEPNAFNYQFENCVIRTPEVTKEEEKPHFVNVVFEEKENADSVCTNHFKKVDGDQQDYDFRLAKTSVAIDRADPATATKTDRNAMPRDERPDVGAYEFKEEKTEEPNPQE